MIIFPQELHIDKVSRSENQPKLYNYSHLNTPIYMYARTEEIFHWIYASRSWELINL